MINIIIYLQFSTATWLPSNSHISTNMCPPTLPPHNYHQDQFDGFHAVVLSAAHRVILVELNAFHFGQASLSNFVFANHLAAIGPLRPPAAAVAGCCTSYCGSLPRVVSHQILHPCMTAFAHARRALVEQVTLVNGPACSHQLAPSVCDHWWNKRTKNTPSSTNDFRIAEHGPLPAPCTPQQPGRKSVPTLVPEHTLCIGTSFHILDLLHHKSPMTLHTSLEFISSIRKFATREPLPVARETASGWCFLLASCCGAATKLSATPDV